MVGFPEARRAHRIICDRPVRIVAPLPMVGRTVNISATGLLMRLPKHQSRWQVGDGIYLAIPRSDGSATMTMYGNVVRIEQKESETRLAINLS
jgi:hypothetical protein